jgi:octaprenyl-diphosphate synthase
MDNIAREIVAPPPPESPVERLAVLAGDDLGAVDDVIHSRMLSEAALIPQLARHLVDSGGKRLRPLITLVSARQFRCSGDAHVKLAAAVEFIHTATLLHDDVVDESTLRRGRPAANTLWGNKPSILVGDFLFSRAFQLMVEVGSPIVLAILANASAVIAEGEVLQLRLARNLAIDEAQYLDVISAKTAALFAAAAEAGAYSAGAEAAQTEAMRRYGYNLGISFQLVDDALDYSGRQAVMGKSVGDDFREAKMTLPVILSLARAGDEERRFWRKTIEVGIQDEGDLSRAIEILERGGSLAETIERARSYARAARESLTACPDSEIRSALADLANFVVERAY